MRHKIRTIEGFVTPEHARGQYVYLPFELPPGTRRIEVTYHYDNQVQGAQESNPGNNIDIGVFDVRGADFLRGGFRGWSGGARSGFFISRDAATPGYLRGPLQAGEWSIIFGLSKITDDVVRYRVNIDADVDTDAGEMLAPPASLELPAVPGAGLRGCDVQRRPSGACAPLVSRRPARPQRALRRREHRRRDRRLHAAGGARLLRAH